MSNDVQCVKCGRMRLWKEVATGCECGSGMFTSIDPIDAYKRSLIEALEKWQHKDSSLNGYYEILDFIKQWEPGEK